MNGERHATGWIIGNGARVVYQKAYLLVLVNKTEISRSRALSRVVSENSERTLIARAVAEICHRRLLRASLRSVKVLFCARAACQLIRKFAMMGAARVDVFSMDYTRIAINDVFWNYVLVYK